MTYYIAGPMTGLPGHNFDAFDRARDHLSSWHNKVVSPADIDRKHGIDGTLPHYDLAELVPVLREELDAIFDVDALYMLRGWENSKGAKLEHALGVLLGKTILYEATF